MLSKIGSMDNEMIKITEETLNTFIDETIENYMGFFCNNSINGIRKRLIGQQQSYKQQVAISNEHLEELEDQLLDAESQFIETYQRLNGDYASISMEDCEFLAGETEFRQTNVIEALKRRQEDESKDFQSLNDELTEFEQTSRNLELAARNERRTLIHFVEQLIPLTYQLSKDLKPHMTGIFKYARNNEEKRQGLVAQSMCIEMNERLAQSKNTIVNPKNSDA
ncbi:hypothetical protein M3Y96_01166200 [Aphelenchoides besseyi]|nr:hypothetical protein M3Y96_01166200 [Aphelenchoides besseyi]